jgi:UDP-N-acetylmuramoylalanine--D-glutamate ligase
LLHIVHESTEDDFYLYNANNPLLVNVETKAKKIAFINAGFTTEGFHQDTIDAVCTLAGLFEYSLDDVKKTIAHFVHLPHRLQNLGQFNGITFVDDSASTVPSATIFALQTLKNVDTLICGGLSRNHSFDLLAQAIIKAGLRNLIIFPDIDAALIKALGPESSNLNILSTSSMKEAVEYSFNQTQNGKICLLSPGFASYNMYSGFPERGTDFQQKIKECSSEYETTSQT